jgi:hypothetical protein
MPLSTAQIATATALVHANRPEWDRSGILAHVEKVAADPRPWPELERQLVVRSSDMTQHTPKCLLEPLPVEAVVRTITPPRHDDPACGKCGSQVVRSDGSCHGCWLNAREDGATAPKPVSPAPAGRRCGPPPPEIKDRIERDFQQRRAARARSEG